MNSDAIPLWFGDPDAPLFGWVHPPLRPRSGGAVVLCPPLYREGLPTQFTYLAMARALCQAGLTVVRFDYAGTGDSAGPSTGPSGVEMLLRSIDMAIALARKHTDGPIALGGLRMGGLLAAKAAERRRDVDTLLLWDPCLSGRSFIRHQQAMYSLNISSRTPSPGVELPGYFVTDEMAKDLGALAFPSSFNVRRALILARPGVKLPDLDLVQVSSSDDEASSGFTVERFDSGEHDQYLNVDPMDRREPTAAIDRMISWLIEALASHSHQEALGESPVSETFLARGAEEPTSISVELDEVEQVVSERVVRLGPLGLFGIETTPLAGPRDLADLGQVEPTVIFLPSGTDNHTGPSRMWVTLAREWGARGFRSIRADLSGLGESPARPGQPEQVVRPPEAFDDVLDVAAAVSTDARGVILVGLCSGAYQALDSAFELKPLAVLGVNPLLRFEPPELAEGGSLYTRRTVCSPRVPTINRWRKRIPAPVIKAAVALRGQRNAKRDRDRFESWHRELAALGVRAYFVCGEDEARGVMGADPSTKPEWLPSGGLFIDVLPGLDHALLGEEDRRAAEQHLTTALLSIAGADSPKSQPLT